MPFVVPSMAGDRRMDVEMKKGGISNDSTLW